MNPIRHPRFLRSLGLAALFACALASCSSGTGGFSTDRLGRMAHVPSVTRAESGDVAGRATAQGEANGTRGEQGRRVRLGLGAGSVW
jgi:hypothetical protein